MILRILKKDLRRKKTMNIILTVFIILAATFISSSVNNILAITGAIDSFFEKANVPDLLAVTIDKDEPTIDDTLASIDAIERYEWHRIIYVNTDNVRIGGIQPEEMTRTTFLHAFGESELKFFDADNREITEVPEGTLRMTVSRMKELGLEVGDEIEIRFGELSKTFTVGGIFKDATVIGPRFMVNKSDLDYFLTAEDAPGLMPGSICYITTSEVDSVQTAISEKDDSLSFIGGQDLLRTGYIMDMIIAGILLVVSVCLILVAFVVLRFTITFTLTEEYREIGVMKAIGIKNLHIRALYMAKYCLLALIGALIGFFVSIPFGEMMLESVSETMVMENDVGVLLNALCSAAVVAVTLLFCYGCTGKIKRFTPVDAIRSGKTGERFKKKGILRLSRSPMKPPFFMAANDILSQPKRFGTVILTFALCLSLVLILVNSVNTLSSDSLITAFGMSKCDLYLTETDKMITCFTADGRERCEKELDEMEAALAEHGLDAECALEVVMQLTVTHGDALCKVPIFQGIRTTADEYDYFEGTPPQNECEIAITRLTANELNAEIGDTVVIHQLEGEKEYIITALFQSMMNMGEGIRLHESAEVSFEQLSGFYPFEIDFIDEIDANERAKRIEQVKEIFDTDQVRTPGEFVERNVGITDTLNALRQLVLAIVLVIIALVTVLMEHSFITKERAEIALMKAVGFSNRSLVAWHCLRFGIAALAATLLALIAMLPLTELTVGPIFSMMGADFGIEYAIEPLEVYLFYPILVLTVTLASAFFTSLHLRSVKASEGSDIE